MARSANLAFVLVAALPLSCGVKESTTLSPPGGAGAPKSTAVVPASFALTAEPAGAIAVKDALTQTKNGDEVVLVGRVGETVKGILAFQLVDASLRPCSEMEMKDDCKTPWDYCCTAPEQIRKSATVVELRQGDHPIAGELLGWNGVDHLKTVVVKGKAERDSAGNLTVAATGLFVRK